MSNPSPEQNTGSGMSNDAQYQAIMQRFWSGNIKLTLWLLLVWAIAGLGCGVLFADKLNEFKLGGYPLGFWFAQQGSIIVFVFIILVFCIVMGKRDAQHHKELEDIKKGGSK